MRRTVGRSIGLVWLVLVAAGCGGPPFEFDPEDASVDEAGTRDDASIADSAFDASAADAQADVTAGDSSGRHDAPDEPHDAGGEKDGASGVDTGIADDGGTDGSDTTDAGQPDATADASGADAQALDGASEAGVNDASAGDASTCAVPCGPLCCGASGKCCSSGSGSGTTYKCAALNVICL